MRTAVNRILATIALCASAATFAAPAPAADMSLAGLGDCGTPQAPIAVNQRFSDTYAYGDLKLQLFTAAISSSTATIICCGTPVRP